MHVFSDVEPEPGEAQIRAGVKVLDELRPEFLIAVGGGSVIDAAKAMRLFHESPELSLEELTLPFLDARKRVAHYPEIEHSVRLVAVPTTAGTGSEVSPAAVLTVNGRKATLVDYSLVPDMAVVEPRLTLSMPPTLTADTGIDALTHALEAAVSIFASPYTDAFCVQAVYQILPNLKRAFEDGSDLEARSAMANAATIAGLAFSNAFVGVNHALAHSVGARFGIAHGRANAIFLPHVLRYNASLPTKFMPAPGYTAYVAPEKYAQIAWIIGLGGKTEAQRRERLFQKVEELLDDVGMPRSLEQAGVGSRRVRDRPAGAGACRLRGREHPHQPPDPACPRADRAARSRLPRVVAQPGSAAAPARAKLLVGYDGTPEAEDALALARVLGVPLGAETVAACVAPVPHRPGARGRLAGLERRAEQTLAGAAGDDLERRPVVSPSPARGLFELAEHEHADCRSICSSSVRAAMRTMLGSIAAELIAWAPCPVLVYPRRPAR